MIKYPSIEQFRHTIKSIRIDHDYKGQDTENKPIYEHTENYPSLLFHGTVKLHGTNAGIVKYKDRIEFQSRERVLSLLQDNSGFMRNMLNKNLDFLFEGISFNEHIAVFGEWCGQGIQKGVAVSTLPPMFVVFGVNIDGKWFKSCPRDPSQNIYNVHDFETYILIVDTNNPENTQNDLIKLTEEVEKECPAGKFFGVSGIGEGIVWSCTHNDKYYQFKTKGDKHSVSKVSTLAAVDTEMLANVQELIEKTVTEARLEQGISYLKENNIPIDIKSTGQFLSWIVRDIIKEEEDTIVKSNIDPKKINSAASNKARMWFINYTNKI